MEHGLMPLCLQNLRKVDPTLNDDSKRDKKFMRRRNGNPNSINYRRNER